MSNTAISVTDLSKKYGDQVAVSHATFEVPLGTICGFVGPNGSGKTTTMRMLLGLITPTGGTGEILGESIKHPERYLPRVGAMIEGPAFYPALTGAENLKVLATLGGFPIERVQTLLEQVGLGDRAKSKYKTYSLGMKQRLSIAIALLHEPELLILDEPTNGLDPQGTREVRNLIRTLAHEGITIFISSHLLVEIEQICTHLAVMSQGKIVAQGSVEELSKAEILSLNLVTGQSDLALAGLKSVGITATADGEHITATVPGGQIEPERIVAVLVELGVGIKSFSFEALA